MGGAKHEPIPTTPIIQITLNRSSFIQTDKDGNILLTPRLQCPADIDHQVKLLKDDLDALAIRAKAAWKKASAHWSPDLPLYSGQLRGKPQYGSG
jgi:hypothetical protein